MVRDLKSDLLIEKAIQAHHRSVLSSPSAHDSRTYNINDLRAVIPPHCFHPSTKLSAAYVIGDLAQVIIVFYLGTFIPCLANSYVRKLCWVAYGFLQGLCFTALWNLAHECGHGALSKHKWFNHGCGMLIHSFLLVPYHSWRYTHQTHHKKTNNLDGDIGFIPPTKQQFLKQPKLRISRLPFYELVEDTPIATFTFLILYQHLAWPSYLIFNNFSLERIRRFKWWKRSHLYFGGDGPSFSQRHFWGILVSDIAIAAVISVIWTLVKRFGFLNVMLFYGVPYLWTNHWMLVIVYLQHTDPRLPFYTQSNFTFLRGAASTMDRDFGFIGRHFFHGTVNYHVLHHHFCQIPFYHAREATEAIRKVMGNAYQCDFETSYLKAFWNNHRTCKYVEAKDPADAQGKVFYFSLEDKRKSRGSA